MFEVKCDVAGCEEREMLPTIGPSVMGGGLPPGWRLVHYETQHQRQNPVKKMQQALRKLSGDGPSEAVGAYLGAVGDVFMGSPAPFASQSHTKHVCPAHELPRFADDLADDFSEPATALGSENENEEPTRP